MSFTRPGGKKSICYYYDPEVGNFYYGQGHPMKPHRIRMAHNLLLNYGMLGKLRVLQPKKATAEQMMCFHSDQYVQFLKHSGVLNMLHLGDRRGPTHHNVGEDSPLFDGLFEYCQISAGGSLAGASRLNRKDTDIAINYAGGLHHAKKEFASGFCYINDIVLAILEMLKVYQKVLYLDIDIHHGDGVEEAFYSTNRVMTVSFHKYGEFFPGTGDIRDLGVGKGKYYAVNVPLREGINDNVYQTIFKPVVNRVMEIFQPEAIVLQCGADSLTGDRLGCFNLSIKGHGMCVSYVKSLGLPTLVVGGGGYTIRNVARCWTYETALLLDEDLSDDLPYNDYFEYYGPDFKLHIPTSNATNMNSSDYLDTIKERIYENLRYAGNCPIDNRELNFEFDEDSQSDESIDPAEKRRPRISSLYSTKIKRYDSDDESRNKDDSSSNQDDADDASTQSRSNTDAESSRDVASSLENNETDKASSINTDPSSISKSKSIDTESKKN